MRKFLLLTLLASCAFVAQAQVVSSTSSLVKKEVRPVDMYIKAGADIGFSLNDQLNPKAGFSLLYGTTIKIGKSGLYYGAEAGIATRKLSYTESDESVYETDRKTETIYEVDYNDYSVSSYQNTTITDYQHRTTDIIDYKGMETFLVPVKLGYKFPISSKCQMDTSLGFYTAFGFESEYSGEVSYITYTNGVESSRSSYTYSGLPAGNINTGLLFGVGVWYLNLINLSMEYQQGLSSAIFDEAKASYFKIAIAVKINKTKEVKVRR
ncbi:MAG: hypothetical protein SNH88_08075 [Rikenellaceae bacterium]